MPNYIWYLGLVAISLVLVAYTLRKKRNPRLIVLFFSIGGVIHPFELGILVLLKGYIYTPQVLSNKWFDSVLAAFVSDAFIVPSAALVIAAFEIGFIWMAAIAATFMGIEWLFLSLGVYIHYWWKTIYTGIGLLVYFGIGKKLWQIISQSTPRQFTRVTVLFFASLIIHNMLTFPFVAVLKKFYFQVGLMTNPSIDHQTVGAIYLYLISIILACMAGLALRWPIKSTGIILLYAFNLILLKLGILRLSPGWSVLNILAINLITLGMLVLFNHLLTKERL